MTLVRDSLDRKFATHLDRSGYRSPWFNVLDAGAIADGSASCTAALQRAIDQCGQTGGGTVVIPAGIYLTGSISMRSNVTLQLEAGANSSVSATSPPSPSATANGKAPHSPPTPP